MSRAVSRVQPHSNQTPPIGQETKTITPEPIKISSTLELRSISETHPFLGTETDSPTASTATGSPNTSNNNSPVLTSQPSLSTQSGRSASELPPPSTTTTVGAAQLSNKKDYKNEDKKQHSKWTIVCLSITMGLSIGLALSFFAYAPGLALLYATAGGMTTFFIANKKLNTCVQSKKGRMTTGAPSPAHSTSTNSSVSPMANPGATNNTSNISNTSRDTKTSTGFGKAPSQTRMNSRRINCNSQ